MHSSSLAFHSLQGMTGWWLFHMCFPEVFFFFFPLIRLWEHRRVAENSSLVCKERGSYRSSGHTRREFEWLYIWMLITKEVLPGTAEMPPSWGWNRGIPKIQQLCKAGPRKGNILALRICYSSISASRWGAAKQGLPTINFVTKTSPNFVQAKNRNIRTHNYSSVHTWAQLKFLFGGGWREMFSRPIFLRDESKNVTLAVSACTSSNFVTLCENPIWESHTSIFFGNVCSSSDWKNPHQWHKQIQVRAAAFQAKHRNRGEELFLWKFPNISDYHQPNGNEDGEPLEVKLSFPRTGSEG